MFDRSGCSIDATALAVDSVVDGSLMIAIGGQSVYSLGGGDGSSIGRSDGDDVNGDGDDLSVGGGDIATSSVIDGHREVMGTMSENPIAAAADAEGIVFNAGLIFSSRIVDNAIVWFGCFLPMIVIGLCEFTASNSFGVRCEYNCDGRLNVGGGCNGDDTTAIRLVCNCSVSILSTTIGSVDELMA